MSAPTTYSKFQIILHWLIAALVAFQILFHDGISNLWKQRMEGDIPNVSTPNPHAIIGILILVLVLVRIFIRLKRGVPALPASEKPMVGMIAKGTHLLFYALLVGMPFTGAIAWFFGLETPALVHGIATTVLMTLIFLHIAAAFMHHFVLKTDVFKRMLGRT